MTSIVSIRAKDFTSSPSSSSAAALPPRVPVASYSWHDKSAQGAPRIITPGYPPELLDHPRTSSLQNDQSTLEMIDENHYRMPQTTCLPIFAAVQVEQPTFQWGGVRIISDRNNLRKLARFLGHCEEKVSTPSFTILAERVGASVILTRVEEKDQGFPVGYGHSFERALTNDSSPSTMKDRIGTYRRIVDLSLAADFRVLIRSECDAIVAKKKSGDEVDLLASKLGQLSLSWKPFHSSTLETLQAGSSSVGTTIAAELKTKNTKYRDEFTWKDVALQMYLGDVETLVVGWLDRGVIQSAERLTFDQVLQRASLSRDKFIANLQQLTALLRRIHEIVTPNKVFQISFAPTAEKTLRISEMQGAASTVNDDIKKILSI